MVFESRTHIGKMREKNEDFVLVRCVQKPKYMMVADGMGGAAAGEIASKIAAFSVGQYIEGLHIQKLGSADLVDAVNYANTQVLNEAIHNERLRDMGTTVTLATADENRVIVAHVGDSSAYMYTDSRLLKMTKDHTYVQDLIDSGLLKQSKAADNPYKNMITRCVGMNGLIVDTYEVQWNRGDILLLCTDGLTIYAGQEDLLRILKSAQTLSGKADALVDYALSSGGRDNISVILSQNTAEESE